MPPLDLFRDESSWYPSFSRYETNQVMRLDTANVRFLVWKFLLLFSALQQVIGYKHKKPVLMKKVLAVYPKGLKVVHATNGTRTMKELNQSALLKFVDIREFQYDTEKSIFRFFYRTVPSNDPLPQATDLQYEFELALLSELNKTIDLALERLSAKRRKPKRAPTPPLSSQPPSINLSSPSPPPTILDPSTSTPPASSSMTVS